jgi:eukaryotic-like serine/threonine-protein kinase
VRPFDPHHSEAKVGGAGIDAHDNLHGFSFWIGDRMPLSDPTRMRLGSTPTGKGGSVAPQPPAFAPSLVADRYRVLRRLGSGGMAAVYLAEDERLGRRVAIKRVPSSGPQEALARFRREVRLGASLNHPNLVSILDSIAGDDDLLIVMEYVEGEPLSRLLEEGPIDPALTIEILGQVAAALDHAHARAVIHRDVKPSNILLRSDGVVKLADMGIATAVGSTRITAVESVIGTLAYIAPERLSGEVGTPSADVYSLAAVAFEALSGERAQKAATPAEAVARATRDSPPDLRQAWPQAPPEAARVLRRAMDRDPQKRPGSAGELVERLDAALLEPELTAGAGGGAGAGSVAETAGRSRWLATGAVIALLAAVGVAIATGLDGPDDGNGRPGAAAQRGEQRANRGENQRQQPAQPASAGQPEQSNSAPPETGGAQAPAATSGAELNDLGYSLIQQGRYDEAIPVLQRAVSSLQGSGGLTYAYALFNLGHALRLAGRPEEAIPYLEQRLRIPNQTDVVAQELALARAAAGIGETGGSGRGNGKGKGKAKGHEKHDD